MRRWEARLAGLVVLWLAVAASLGGALTLAGVTGGPLDDPDLALERPGFLDAHHVPTPAPSILASPFQGRRAVVFFVRQAQQEALDTALRADGRLSTLAGVVVVVAGSAPAGGAAGRNLADPGGAIAKGFDMRVPRDGGPPVGYAVIDSRGFVRYRTLDPGMAGRLDEVATMVKAVP